MCPAGSVYPSVRACKAVVNPYLEQVVDLAHQQGTLRPDCTVLDIAYLQVVLVGIMDASPDSPEASRHPLRLFLDGARFRQPPSPPA